MITDYTYTVDNTFSRSEEDGDGLGLDGLMTNRHHHRGGAAATAAGGRTGGGMGVRRGDREDDQHHHSHLTLDQTTAAASFPLLGDFDTFLSEIVRGVDDDSHPSLCRTVSPTESELSNSYGSSLASSYSSMTSCSTQYSTFDPSFLTEIEEMADANEDDNDDDNDGERQLERSAPKRRRLPHTWGRSNFHSGVASELLSLDPPVQHSNMSESAAAGTTTRTIRDDVAAKTDRRQPTSQIRKRARARKTSARDEPADVGPNDTASSVHAEVESESDGTIMLSLPQTADMFLGPIVSADEQSAAFVFRDKPKTPLQYREARLRDDGTTGFDVVSWTLTAKVSVKERWQIFAATAHMVFSAAQNAATIGCWNKVDGSGAGSDIGRINLLVTEAITAYPHQMQAFDDVLVIGGRDCHYDDIKHQVPTAMLVLFDLIDGGRQHRHRSALRIEQFDAISQLAGQGTSCAVTGFPRDAVSYDAETGKRKNEMENRRFPVLLLDMASWDRKADRVIDAHDDVISRLQLRDSTLFTASWDNTVKLWNIPPVGAVTLRRVISCCLPTSLAPLREPAGSLFSASLDGVIRRWADDGTDVPTDQINLVNDSAHLLTPLSMEHFGSTLLTSHFGKCVYDLEQFCGIRVWKLAEGRPLIESAPTK